MSLQTKYANLHHHRQHRRRRHGGEIGSGIRRIIPITGGEVRGEDISGKVCAFGADFQIIRPNELIELEAKYAFETDDGAVVYVENKGMRFGPVDRAEAEARRAGRPN